MNQSSSSVVQVATDPTPACDPNAKAALPERKPIVLFVDDEQSILVSLKRLSRKMPWQVFTANNGEEALRIVDENTVNVVVSDMRMPEMNGAEVLGTINQRSPNTRQILMTGYSDMESTVKAINDANIYSYIAKPWDNDNLKATIERALYEQSLEAERNSLSSELHEKNAELAAMNGELEERVTKRTSQLEKAIRVIKKSAKQAKDAQIETVKLLSNMIEQRGMAAPGRAARVAKMSCHLANKLDFDEDTVESVYFAGLLSDIGKMALPDKVLNVSYDELTPQNQELYKQHPILAEATLMSIDALKPTAVLLRQQCEKYGGGGYPDNLMGDKLIVGAQLIGISSYFDRLRYGYLSEQGLDPEEMIKKLRISAGARFSEQLVALFIDELESGMMDSMQVDECKLTVDDLHEGMTLSRDLVADNGVLLFSEGKVLLAPDIERINDYLQRSHSSLTIFVNSETDMEEQTECESTNNAA